MLSASQMVFSLGAVAGGFLMAAWGGFADRRHTILLATAFYGGMMLGTGLASVFPLYLLCNGLIGIALPCYNTPVTVLFQERTDPQMLGRIFGLLQVTNACALPLGILIFGPLADVLPVGVLLAVNGLAVMLFALYALLGRFFREDSRL